jgi:hypothetical protein
MIKGGGAIFVAYPSYPASRKALVETMSDIDEKVWHHSNKFSMILTQTKRIARMSSLVVLCTSYHALMFKT